MRIVILLNIITALSISSSAFAGGAQQARNIAEVAQRAARLVDSILARQGNNFQPAGPHQGVRPFIWQNESDALALPAYTQAGAYLGQSATAALESQAAYLSGQIQLGNFKFVAACGQLALGKLALARANLAAIQPPVGLFAPFNQLVFQMLNDIETTRNANGCI